MIFAFGLLLQSLLKTQGAFTENREKTVFGQRRKQKKLSWNGQFDSTDLIAVFEAGSNEDGVANNFDRSTGDWNGDREFDTSDFVAAIQAGRYETFSVR